MFVYATSLVFDGAIRWMLESVGAVSLLYLRDGLLIAATLCALSIGRAYLLDSWRRLVAATLAFMAIWLLWGWFNGLPIGQGLFGLKTLLPVLAGMSVYVLLSENWQLLYRFCGVAAIVALSGLVTDYFRDLPWAGLVYEVGDVSVEGQRQWTIDSVERLGGFGRASTDVAGQLLLFLAVILSARANNAVRIILVLGCMAGIVMTTSRSYLLGAVLLVMACMALAMTRSVAVRVALAIVPLLPIGVIALGYQQVAVARWLQTIDRGGALAMESAFIRMDDIWLDAVSQLDDLVSWIFGKGLGSIGAASKYFAPETYNPADNLLIYTLVSFGIVGSVVVFATLLIAFWKTLMSVRLSFGVFLAAVSGSGVAMSCLENPAVGMGLGLALSTALTAASDLRGPQLLEHVGYHAPSHRE